MLISLVADVGSNPTAALSFFFFFRLAELVDAVSSKLIYCWFKSSNDQGYRLIGRTTVFGTVNVGSNPTIPMCYKCLSFFFLRGCAGIGRQASFRH